jgi:Ca2+-binding RTX toxin-like protein
MLGVVVAGLAADALLINRQDDPDEAEDSGLVDDTKEATGGAFLDDLDSGSNDATSDNLFDGGDDAQEGEAGTDTLLDDQGDDWLNGGDYDDWAAAGDDHALLRGGVGDDSLVGGCSDDALEGDAGADTLLGDQGDDWLNGGDDDDWVAGGDGNDVLVGGRGADILDGGKGNDTISGREDPGESEQVDYLNGQDGDDGLSLGVGDYATGGEGSDKFELNEPMAQSSIARVMDYDPAHDQLIVKYDPSVHPDPVVTVEPNDDGTEQVVFLDGSKLAIVYGGTVDPLSVRLVST